MNGSWFRNYNKKTAVIEEGRTGDIDSWKPFLRQLLICSGMWASFFVYGLVVGAPTVFIPQIRSEANSTAAVSNEMASWLSSAYSFSGFPWVIILAVLTKCIGRRISFIIAVVDILIALLVLYFSTTVNQILVSMILEGVFAAAQMVVLILIMTEYTSPRYRGMFLSAKYASFQWGIWTSNAVGTFFHWKNIGLVGIVCALYVLVVVIISPESPYWLASRKRYEECETSHRWLKGCDIESEKELESLIHIQKVYFEQNQTEQLTFKQTILNSYTTMTSREFYKPTLISILTGTLGVVSGKLVLSIYAIDILKKVTDKESFAYTGMLILDGISVIGMYLGCILMKFIKRRKMLIVASSIAVIFLCIMSLYLYLIHLSVIIENKYVSVGILSLFSISISCGPTMMSVSIYGELIPLKSRNLAICVITLAAKLSIGVFLKISPYIFKLFDMHGTFLFFGIASSLCILLLYFYLPETKDKTLQEIADSMNGITK